MAIARCRRPWPRAPSLRRARRRRASNTRCDYGGGRSPRPSADDPFREVTRMVPAHGAHSKRCDGPRLEVVPARGSPTPAVENDSRIFSSCAAAAACWRRVTPEFRERGPRAPTSCAWAIRSSDRRHLSAEGQRHLSQFGTEVRRKRAGEFRDRRLVDLGRRARRLHPRGRCAPHRGVISPSNRSA